MSRPGYIQHGEELLQGIADGLKRLEEENKHIKLGCLEVKFFEDEKCVMTSDLVTALNYLANDIYWDENSNWSLADKATVNTF